MNVNRDLVYKAMLLVEAAEIIRELLEIKGAGPSEILRQAKVGIGSKTKSGAAVLRAAAFLEQHEA